MGGAAPVPRLQPTLADHLARGAGRRPHPLPPHPAESRRLKDVNRMETLRPYCLARLEEHLGQLREEKRPCKKMGCEGKRLMGTSYCLKHDRPTIRPPAVEAGTPGQPVTGPPVASGILRRRGLLHARRPVVVADERLAGQAVVGDGQDDHLAVAVVLGLVQHPAGDEHHVARAHGQERLAHPHAPLPAQHQEQALVGVLVPLVAAAGWDVHQPRVQHLRPERHPLDRELDVQPLDGVGVQRLAPGLAREQQARGQPRPVAARPVARHQRPASWMRRSIGFSRRWRRPSYSDSKNDSRSSSARRIPDRTCDSQSGWAEYDRIISDQRGRVLVVALDVQVEELQIVLADARAPQPLAQAGVQGRHDGLGPQRQERAHERRAPRPAHGQVLLDKLFGERFGRIRRRKTQAVAGESRGRSRRAAPRGPACRPPPTGCGPTASGGSRSGRAPSPPTETG